MVDGKILTGWECAGRSGDLKGNGWSMKRKLPVGIDDFEKIRRNNFYYVDKTMFIAELMENWGEVNLLTRPRRFGKSLNMSMLKAFFEIGSDPTLFDGLKISREKELFEKHMGQYPVISITLKSLDAPDFEASRGQIRKIIGTEAERFPFLEHSERLSENERKQYRALIHMEAGNYVMRGVVLENSLQTLSALLARHFGRKVIILVDEYDVPLDKAFQRGYYEEMLSMIRSLLGNALKTNPFLHFAVLTGCLRISRESIFTGMNNFSVMTVTDPYFNEAFGFTETEVRAMLSDYELEDALETVRSWYNGYLFGGVSLYCPWDVVKYIQALLKNRDAPPEDYWANTSGNALVLRFIRRADQRTRDDIESLIAGETVVKEVRQELTYKELDDSIENLWSVLLTTGYLTAEERLSARKYRLRIPNLEIRDLFIFQVKEWFREKTEKQPGMLDEFCSSLLLGKAELVEKILTEYLKQTISIRDTGGKKTRKEHFYHGFLLGLFSHQENWGVRSNEETGEGYSDILIRDSDANTGVIVEVKYAENAGFDAACERALRQIEEKKYAETLYDDGMEKIVKYGMAFYKKRCRVICSLEQKSKC